MNRSQWTSAEIKYLNHAYFSGKKIKVIANELNRTEMSINKAIARFNIRPKLIRTPRPKLPAQLNRKAIRAKRSKGMRNLLHDNWVTIQKMFDWMTNNGIRVITDDKTPCVFKVDNVPMTLGQLLLRCNRLRLAKGLAIFRVKGITNV